MIICFITAIWLLVYVIRFLQIHLTVKCRLEGTVLTTNKQAGYTRCYRSYIDNHNTILEIYKYFFT